MTRISDYLAQSEKKTEKLLIEATDMQPYERELVLIAFHSHIREALRIAAEEVEGMQIETPEGCDVHKYDIGNCCKNDTLHAAANLLRSVDKPV